MSHNRERRTAHRQNHPLSKLSSVKADHRSPSPPGSSALKPDIQGVTRGLADRVDRDEQDNQDHRGRVDHPVSADNLCHQAIFVDDATYAAMPPDPEMIQVGNAIWQRP
jgi:hypothetical protein